MSFSFRNIFSPDEGDLEGGSSGLPISGQNGADRNDDFGGGPGSAEVSYQAFLASELLAFIPPAISARSGIPMEKEIHVPFTSESNRDVRLSTLYQMCPELFAAEITPLNDSVVTLPPRLGLSSAPSSSPVAGASRSATAASDSRAAVANGASASAASNPFWSPVSVAEPTSGTAKPFAMKDETPPPATGTTKPWSTGPIGAGDNPFSSHGPSAGTPPSGPGSMAAKTPGGPKIGGGFDAPPASSGSGPETGGLAGGFQGFETSPPASVFAEGGSERSKPPVEEKTPGFNDNPFESKHGFTTLFSKGAAADSGIPFPSAPVQEEKAEEEPQGTWGAMFHGGAATSAGGKPESAEAPAAAPLFEGFGSMITKASELKEASPWGNFSAPFAGDSPFESVPEAKSTDAPSFPEPVPGKGPGMEFAVFESFPIPVEPEVPVVSKKPVPEVSWTIEPTAPKPAPAPPVDTPAPFPAFQGVPSPAKEASGFASVRSQAEATPPPPSPEKVAAAPFAPRESAEPVLSGPASDQTFDLRDLELKAIFSTSETFTLSKVARRVVGLPGISSCALSTPGKLVQASRSEESRIGNEAREMVTTLRNLAKLTGLPEARTFTLHTDRGIVSLFLEDECCVTVHHESAAFPPGVREKLILVARSLINLED